MMQCQMPRTYGSQTVLQLLVCGARHAEVFRRRFYDTQEKVPNGRLGGHYRRINLIDHEFIESTIPHVDIPYLPLVRLRYPICDKYIFKSMSNCAHSPKCVFLVLEPEPVKLLGAAQPCRNLWRFRRHDHF